MQSKAATVEQYLAELPPDRREALSAVRRVIVKNLDKGYQECMQYGMIGYSVPHSIFPDGYHCDPRQPLPFAGLASQKGHMSFYLSCIYSDTDQAKRFRKAWLATGKKLDMGKACIRFKRVDDLALDVIADTVREMTLKKFLDFYAAALRLMKKQAEQRSADRKAAPAKPGPAPKKTKKATRKRAKTAARGS